MNDPRGSSLGWIYNNNVVDIIIIRVRVIIQDRGFLNIIINLSSRLKQYFLVT